MDKLEELYIVNYCHSNCEPLQNIMRLPKEAAFALAEKLAKENPSTTAFGRFADFQKYYSERVETDELLYKKFCALGGRPQTKHPLSFVLQGSDFLQKWFDNGREFRIPFMSIPEESISFTYGDSMTVLRQDGMLHMVTKSQLLEEIGKFETGLRGFFGNSRENISLYRSAAVG